MAESYGSNQTVIGSHSHQQFRVSQRRRVVRHRHTLYNWYMYPIPHHFHHSDSELLTVSAMTVPSLLELSAIPYPRNLTPFLVLPSKSAYVFPFPHFSNSSFPFLLLHQPTRILVYIYLMLSPSLVPKHSNTSSF